METANLSSTPLYHAISSETTPLPIVDFRAANTISQVESAIKCLIKEGFLISRPHPHGSARVSRSFSIFLLPTEEGYVATSDLCNIYELEQTMSDAIWSYLYSLIDELIWLEKNAEHLSTPLKEELDRIKTYIKIV